MVTTTVDHGHSHASTSPVKNESGFSVKAWLFGRRDEPEPEPFAPDAQSRWVVGHMQAEARKLHARLDHQQAQIETPRPVQGEHAFYNIHPRALLRRLQHLAVDLDADVSLGTRDCVKALHEVLDEFDRAALDEDKAQTQYETRTGRNRRAAEAKGHRLTVAALDDGEDAQLKTARIETADGEVREYLPGSASKIVANALHASDPGPTALQVALTPDVLERLDAGEPIEMVPAPAEVTQVLAPLHPWDAVNGDGVIRSDDGAPSVSAAPAEVQPAVPHEPSPQASKLPRRRRVTSFPAAMSADPGVPLDGAQHEAVDLEVMPGAWLLDGGAWRLVSAVVLDAEAQSVAVTLADETEIPPFGHDAPVWLLSADVAARMALAAGAEAHR